MTIHSKPQSSHNKPTLHDQDAIWAPLAQVEDALKAFIQNLDIADNLKDAIAYSALSGGKRLRPILCFHACQALGTSGTAALLPGVAIELIHAFSLVHDDLPAMDDDELRRGKPTLHIHAGQAMAILAGDAMNTLAFSAITQAGYGPELTGQLITELADATTAMIVGQVYDTLGGLPSNLTDLQKLQAIHRNKTGALIRAACRMGAQVAIADPASTIPESSLTNITVYAEAIGLMFQIIDDLLDVEQSSEHLGKKAGKDIQAGKLTYPGIMGIKASHEAADEMLVRALNAIKPMGVPAEPLRELAHFLAVRTR